MQFEKNVVFLGYKDMILKDGTTLYSVDFYVDNMPVTVNVQASSPVSAALPSLKFAESCSATFVLRKSDKLYRLSLANLVAGKSH